MRQQRSFRASRLSERIALLTPKGHDVLRRLDALWKLGSSDTDESE
ncbi:hypothetical protein [Caballeronia calidae]|nr:hypothetical protein [Caballeronia calidae]